jgi:hypothetical protein
MLMTLQEKTLARKFFKLKIHEANGSRFEDLFTAIMNYYYTDFQQIKPWGNIGDRKNDGYVKSTGTYFQVYAPEEIKNNYPELVSKLEVDFAGLIKQWSPINEFYFVVNDKYLGVNADSEKAIQQLVTTKKLKKGGFITPKDLENTLFGLSDDQILSITGFLPDETLIANIDFSVLNEVIAYIMKLPSIPTVTKIDLPDWDKKIKFNKVGTFTTAHLQIAAQNIGDLNQFLSNEPFLSDNLQKKVSGIYNDIKASKTIDLAAEDSGDLIFWKLVERCSPKNELQFMPAVITIVAKYFESCDVFEKNPDAATL